MLIRADARAIPLREGSIDCVVTSPPYFGLRNYGDERQIGAESTPEAYVASIVGVFSDVRRALKESGVVWLNLGDTYAGSGRGTGTGTGTGDTAKEAAVTMGAGKDRLFKGSQLPAGFHEHKGTRESGAIGRAWTPVPGGLKQKDLIGVPWRVAFALQADGWYLRADVIWAKPNPMPESVQDRPTKAHEYIFLLTKNERYFYDAAAIAESVSASMLEQLRHGYDGEATKDYAAAGVQDPSAVKSSILKRSGNKARKLGAERGRPDSHLGGSIPWEGLTRNKRSVWTVPVMPYAGAHFATMPEKLVEPCIMAGCPLGGLVFDPFVGTGTVIAVAERLGRRGVGLDLSYQELAAERTQQRGLRFV